MPRALNRLVECSHCRARQRLVFDRLDFVELPPNWRSMGRRRDGSPLFVCPACVELLAKESNADALANPPSAVR